jgi:hypothetical protein
MKFALVFISVTLFGFLGCKYAGTENTPDEIDEASETESVYGGLTKNVRIFGQRKGNNYQCFTSCTYEKTPPTQSELLRQCKGSVRVLTPFAVDLAQSVNILSSQPKIIAWSKESEVSALKKEWVNDNRNIARSEYSNLLSALKKSGNKQGVKCTKSDFPSFF